MPVLQRITNPLELSSNFVLSVEANNLDGYNINDPVTTWVDNSGLNNNLVQTSESRKPKFEIDSFGYKCLKFTYDNKTNLTSTLSYPLQDNLTVSMCLRIDSFLSSAFITIISTGPFPLYDRLNISSIAKWIAFASSRVTPNNFVSTNNTYPNFDKCVITLRRSNSFIEVFINKRRVVAGSINSFNASTTLQKIEVADDIINSTTYVNGAYYHIHVCHEFLSDEKLQKLIRYVAFKSGVNL
jgi:hypothetical protein